MVRLKLTHSPGDKQLGCGQFPANTSSTLMSMLVYQACMSRNETVGWCSLHFIKNCQIVLENGYATFLEVIG